MAASSILGGRDTRRLTCALTFYTLACWQLALEVGQDVNRFSCVTRAWIPVGMLGLRLLAADLAGLSSESRGPTLERVWGQPVCLCSCWVPGG